ncbi:MAG: hypothetical protein ACP5O7_03655 [Phycisphaerae bacterium]
MATPGKAAVMQQNNHLGVYFLTPPAQQPGEYMPRRMRVEYAGD